MAARKEPLDEIMYARPEINQWYMTPESGFSMGFMDENMIHRYLAESPFFDFGSKNGMPIDQSKSDLGAWNLTHDRKKFEQWLSNTEGVEYVVVDGKTQNNKVQPPQGGLYVLRKQDRRKAKGGKDELSTLGTYYSIGERMYQAPSVGDVLSTKLTAAATALSDFFEQVSQLPKWTPTTGYTYLQPVNKPATAGSAAATPLQSREASVAPGLDSQSVRSGSVQPGGSSAGQAADPRDTRLLAQSLQMALQYGDEHMDDNPIIGEPGHFSFTSSTAAVKKRKADEDAALVKARELAAFKAATPAASPKAEKPPSPPAVMTEAKTVKTEKDRKGKGDKIRRKKSRPGQTPAATPVSATPKSGL